jgi:hypothetical protein
MKMHISLLLTFLFLSMTKIVSRQAQGNLEVTCDWDTGKLAVSSLYTSKRPLPSKLPPPCPPH